MVLNEFEIGRLSGDAITGIFIGLVIGFIGGFFLFFPKKVQSLSLQSRGFIDWLIDPLIKHWTYIVFIRLLGLGFLLGSMLLIVSQAATLIRLM